MNRETLTKVYSTSLSLALVLTSAPIPAGAVGPVGPAAPAFVAGLTPPERFGYVASSYAPHNEDKPRLIIIADLHGHVDVQKNIMEMLDSYVNTLTKGDSALSSQNHVPIYVEGGWKPGLEHPLRDVKDSNMRAILASYFLDKAEIQAAQAYTEKYPNATNVSLIGVEDKVEFDLNGQRFAETYPMRKRLLEAIARHEEAFNSLNDDSQVGAFNTLHKLREAFLAGKVPSERYAGQLVRYSRKLGIQNQFVDAISNLNASKMGDVEMAMAEVHRQINERLSSKRPLTSYFRSGGSEEEGLRKNLGRVDSYLDLLKRTLSVQLTPEEVPFVYARLPQMAQAAEALLGDDKLNIDILSALRKSFEFYALALMRDETLIKNSMAAMGKESGSTTGILVAGGFHTGAISDYLREHHIAHMVVDPVVDRDMSTVEQLNYIKRVCNEHVTRQEVAEDFRYGRSYMQLSGSSKADAVVSDRAPSVNAAPDIAPQVDNAVEGINDAKKKDPSGGNALLAGDGSDLALLALGDQTVIKRVTGAVEIAAEAGRGAAVAEATARVAALTEKIAGTNSNTFVKINEQNGATAVLEGGHYVVTGVEAAQFQPLLDAATRAHGTDRAPETLYFQEMTTELQVALERNKMSLAQRAAVAVLRGIGWNRSADKVRGDVFANYYTMPISDKASVVFYKKDDFDISHFQNTLKEIHQGAPVTTERSRIVEQGTSRLHEIVHNVAPLATVQVGKTEIAYNSEVRTETDSLGLLLTMGEEATKTGVNHSAGVPATGLSASYASQLVTAAQGAFRGSARRAGRAFSENADAAGNLSLTGALNALHIGLQTNEALAAEKQAMRDRLKAAYPEDSEYQEEQAVEVAYGRGVLSLFQSSKIRQEKAMAVMAAMSEKGKWFRPKA